ncbi:hypothetical protein L6164_015654 [Bauhinia variegata]|uniref:Uncharacterized protein n=1 Tax=Bauhinia variegata TaxID=167791 RepID=A0ACB9NN06_BAUVA|nr:hypothetical protein L6164_015654 [Bauhinia variegata]
MHADKAAEYVTGFLICQWINGFCWTKLLISGLPMDFSSGQIECTSILNILSWSNGLSFGACVLEPAWAITELEEKVLSVTDTNSYTSRLGMGMLSFSLFPMKSPGVSIWRTTWTFSGKMSYLSPYPPGGL